MRSAGGTRIFLVVVMTVLALLSLRDFARLGPGLPWRTMDDFPDFYCAGLTLDGGASPYTYEPLHACEHRVNTGATFRGLLFASNPGVAVPAPQPPFDFVPFTVLARLPFGVARTIDAFAILLAVALCVYALAAARVPWQLSAAAFALSTAFVELNTGQIVPFALLALVLAGLALARRRDAFAGILAALTAIEPTAGVPVIAATLLFVPRARAPAIGTILVLAAVSLAIGGPHGFVEYLARVLPAHAASEVHFPYQYSLTYAAAFFGLSSAAAQLVGTLGYLAAVVLALAIAGPASVALSRRDLLVFLPALCAVAGGAFLHQEEICFALPALLVFTTTLRGRAQVASAIALCLLAVPWILVWGSKQLFLASIFVCAAVVIAARIEWRAALTALLAIAAVIYAFELHPPHLPVPSLPPAYPASALVQSEWRDYAEGRATRDPLWFAVKLPTWAALAAAIALASSLALRPRNASESSRKSSRESWHPPTA
ncbi:MAG TPA: glycosyltransferase family 87 protein [Candidatus Cybelea sp.]|nr:glycosyltransferase family 87 protein [Candidatus Cybelea sp.]